MKKFFGKRNCPPSFQKYFVHTYVVTACQLQGAHLLEQMNNKLKEAAARNVVNAMDFFLPMISSRIKIHMVPEGKGNSCAYWSIVILYNRKLRQRDKFDKSEQIHKTKYFCK